MENNKNYVIPRPTLTVIWGTSALCCMRVRIGPGLGQIRTRQNKNGTFYFKITLSKNELKVDF